MDGALPFKVHPAAEKERPMTDYEYRMLRDGMREDGLLHPIVLLGDMILDGRHRARACVELGIELRTVQVPPDTDPDEYVRAANVHRRHLTRKEQLAQVLDVPTLKRGNVNAQRCGGQICPSPPDTSAQRDGIQPAPRPLANAEGAQVLGVSPRTFKSIKFVRDNGTPDHIARLEAGEAPSALEKEIRMARMSGAVVECVGDDENAIASAPDESAPTRRRPLKIPSGEGIVEFARKLVEQQKDGISLKAVAAQNGLNFATASAMVDVILVGSRSDLSPTDQAVAARAVAQMEADGRPEAALGIIEPICLRLWGAPSMRRVARERIEANRLHDFEHAFGAIAQAGICAGGLEVPHLSPARVSQAIGEMNEAIAGMQKLLRVLKERRT